MPDMVTINKAAKRAKADGLPISEYILRKWVKCGEIPHRKAGVKVLIYYPALVRYLRCEDEVIGGNNGK